MDTWGRWAPYLTMAGGAIFAVTLILLAFDPTSPAAFGFLPAIILLGAAIPGLYRRTRPKTRRLGWASAWLSGLGTVGAVTLAILGIATNQLSLTDPNAAMTPLLAAVLAAFIAWLFGNLGFAASLIRTRALPPLGAWLVLAGAVVAVPTLVLVSESTPDVVIRATTLLWVLLPAGWLLVGYEAWSQERR